MLLSLHVKNLALIDEVEVSFFDHLNILSGETGAGKSIIIGSVNAALGGKISKDMIRSGADYGLVELLFHVDQPELVKQLAKKDIYPDEGQILITRKITPGKNICKINGEMVTLGFLKEISGLLLDLHGQNEHQSLQKESKHLEILDAYIGHSGQKIYEQYKKAYEQYNKIKQEYEKLDLDEEKRARESSFLEFEIQEILDANLKEGEDEKIENLYKKQENAKQIIEAISNVYGMMQKEDGESMSNFLSQSIRELAPISHVDKETASLYEQLNQLDDLFQDFSRDLRSYVDDLSFEPGAFDEAAKRLDVINQCKLKYGNTISKILDNLKEKQELLEKYQNYNEYKLKLQETYNKAVEQVKTAGLKVTALRKKYAKQLAEEITKVLVDLNFITVQFEVEISQVGQITSKGLDQACFKISTNPGLPLRPMSQVASGGELSRIMLAVKSVLAQVDQIPTLVFDEIDVGISGRTAQMVAEKLNVIAKTHQVICITHLPQIAAMADSHFLIAKDVDEEEQSTKTSITMLNQAAEVEELARLLGGARITEAVRQNAKEMKELARRTKIY